ncbi:MAG: hypothetical protein ACXWC8_05080, partial [Limisphaerales bacterium]
SLCPPIFTLVRHRPKRKSAAYSNSYVGKYTVYFFNHAWFPGLSASISSMIFPEHESKELMTMISPRSI